MKKFLLAGTALFAMATLPSGTAYAQCAASGQIGANCNTAGAFTGAVTIDNGVAVTLTGDHLGGQTIDGTAADGDGTLQTNNLGISVNQTAAIGATTELNQITILGADSWTSSAEMAAVDMDLTGTLNVNSGGFIDMPIDGAGGVINIGADTNGGDFLAGGTIDEVTLNIVSGTFENTDEATDEPVPVVFGATTPLAALNISAGATFLTDEDVTIGGALDNDGTMRLASGFTTQAATYTGNDGGAGVFYLEVENDNGTQQAGSLVLTGGAVDLSGDTVIVTVNDLSGSLTAGTIAGVFQGTGAPTAPATFSENSTLYDFALNANGNNFDLVVTVNNNVVSSSNTTTNNAEAGSVLLNDLSGSNDSTINTAQTNLANASTQEEIDEVLESIQPTVDGGSVAGAISVSNSVLSVTGTQLAALRTGTGGETGIATGDIRQGMRFWGQAFGQTAEQDKRDGIDGYDSDTYGVALGIDSENVHDDAVIGIAFSYADTEVDSENANTTKTEIDSYQVTLYGDFDVSQRMYVSGMLGYAYGDNDIARHNVGGAGGPTATASFDSDQFVAQLETGRDYNMHGNGPTITPNLLAHYVYYDAESYTETGAGGLNQAVDSDSLQIFELGIGATATWKHRLEGGTMVKPQLRVGYRYDFADDAVEATSRFTGGGNAFSTEGADPAQSTFNAGGALKFYDGQDWEFTANYDFEVKSDYDAHNGFLRAAYRF